MGGRVIPFGSPEILGLRQLIDIDNRPFPRLPI